LGGTGQMDYQVGDKPYHDANELTMSNAMDIVDARTVAGPAEVTHWMSRKTIRRIWDRFFRQFFDIKTFRGSKGSELSVIR